MSSTFRLLMAAMLALAAPPLAHAQSGAQANAWAAWCVQQGGHVQITGSNPVCIPGSSSSQGGGYTASEQAMLDLAGQFGSALGAAIRQSFANAARQEQINRMQEAWEREQAVQQAAADLERQRLRNQNLIANMHGAIGASELGRTQLGTERLQLRTTDQMFGNGGEQRDAVTQEVPVSGVLDLTEMRAAQEAYFAAMDAVNDAEGEVRGQQTINQSMRDLIAEAEARRDAQRLLVNAMPANDPRRAPEATRLAELEADLASAHDDLADYEQLLGRLEAQAADARADLRAASERRSAASTPAAAPGP